LLGDTPENRVQNAEVIGIGAQGMDHVKLSLTLWWEYGPGIDPSSPGPKRPPAPAKDCAEGTLGDGCYLTNKFELVVIQPCPHTRIQLGQHIE
jgi:hypothetical protein